jgi:selenocysteine lyase/cysteine desulfurase
VSRWQRLRSFFPVAEDAIFLDHAGGGPLSSRADEAVRKASDDAAHRVGSERRGRESRNAARVRKRVAALIRAEPEEIAFVSHANAGLALVAADVDWQAGDRIVLAEDAAAPAWSALRERRVDTLRISTGPEGMTADRLAEALLHPRARLLFLAAVDPLSGARAPLQEIGDACRQRGVLLCVDASHGLGALDIDAPGCGVDYLVCDGHRFLMALSGCALLYRGGRLAADGPSAAARFESGPANHTGIAALGAAVDLLLEIGPSAIEARVLALTRRLVEGLAERGIAVASPHGRATSAIVGFRLAGESPGRTVERLFEGRIHVAETAAGVRVSPHFYNQEAEIDALLEAL